MKVGYWKRVSDQRDVGKLSGFHLLGQFPTTHCFSYMFLLAKSQDLLSYVRMLYSQLYLKHLWEVLLLVAAL